MHVVEFLFFLLDYIALFNPLYFPSFGFTFISRDLSPSVCPCIYSASLVLCHKRWRQPYVAKTSNPLSYRVVKMSNARSALRLTCTDCSCISQLISCHSLMFTHAFVTSTFLTIYTYISNSILHQVNSSQRPLGQSILLMSIINSCVLLIKEFDNIIKSVKVRSRG